MEEYNNLRSMPAFPKVILLLFVLVVCIILLEIDPVSNYTKIEHYNNGGNLDCKAWNGVLLNNTNSELRDEEVFRDKFIYHLDDCKVK